MSLGGRRVKARTLCEVATEGGSYCVSSTALEVQEMIELAYQAGHPEKLLPLTFAFTESPEAPWHGKPLLVRADAIFAITPPSEGYGDDEDAEEPESGFTRDGDED